MLRSFLIYLSKAAWAQRLVVGWKFAWRAASRFVAGNSINDAINAVEELNEKGINATLDHLGESTSTREKRPLRQQTISSNYWIKSMPAGFARMSLLN